MGEKDKRKIEQNDQNVRCIAYRKFGSTSMKRRKSTQWILGYMHSIPM